MSEKQKIMDALAVPFPANRLKFRVGARTKNKDRGIALPYVDARDYYARLNEVLGLDWEDEETISYDGNRVTVKYRLTLHISDESRTRTGDGECSDLRDENAVTTASAQAFKRACVKFGLGAGLYDIPRQWVELRNKRYIPDPTKVKLRRAYAQWIESGQWSFGDRRPPQRTSQPQQQKGPKKASSQPQRKATHGNGHGAAGITLHFGKYEGKTLQQVLREDPDYVAYLADKAYDDTVRQAAASIVPAA
jgi:hypothetical protein